MESFSRDIKEFLEHVSRGTQNYVKIETKVSR